MAARLYAMKCLHHFYHKNVQQAKIINFSRGNEGKMCLWVSTGSHVDKAEFSQGGCPLLAPHGQDGTDEKREDTRSFPIPDPHEVMGKLKSRKILTDGTKVVLRIKSPEKLQIHCLKDHVSSYSTDTQCVL